VLWTVIVPFIDARRTRSSCQVTDTSTFPHRSHRWCRLGLPPGHPREEGEQEHECDRAPVEPPTHRDDRQQLGHRGDERDRPGQQRPHPHEERDDRWHADGGDDRDGGGTPLRPGGRCGTPGDEDAAGGGDERGDPDGDEPEARVQVEVRHRRLDRNCEQVHRQRHDEQGGKERDDRG